MVNEWDFLGFKSTGVAEVDAILEEVSTSAKLQHNATYWADNQEWQDKSRIETIQEAANRCAQALRDKK